LTYAVRWRLVIRGVGLTPPLAHLVAARLAGDALGSVVPSARLAGEPVRVAALHTRGAPMAPAAAGVALDRVVELTGQMVAVIAYAAVIALTVALGAAPLALAGVMLALLTWMALLLVYLKRQGGRRLHAAAAARRPGSPRARWLGGLAGVADHLRGFLRSHPAMFCAALGLALLTEVIIVAQYTALFRAFGLALDLPTVLVVLLSGGLSRAAPTPAGLGATEAAQVLAVGSLTGNPDLGFVVGLIVRLHDTLLLAAGLAALPLLGLSLTRRALSGALGKVAG
jgi:undecaprenyl-diphosphatase